MVDCRRGLRAASRHALQCRSYRWEWASNSSITRSARRMRAAPGESGGKVAVRMSENSRAFW